MEALSLFGSAQVTFFINCYFIYLLLVQMVMVCEMDLLRKYFIKHGEIFNGRWQNFITDSMLSEFNNQIQFGSKTYQLISLFRRLQWCNSSLWREMEVGAPFNLIIKKIMLIFLNSKHVSRVLGFGFWTLLS
jgi:hypothetical protein